MVLQKHPVEEKMQFNQLTMCTTDQKLESSEEKKQRSINFSPEKPRVSGWPNDFSCTIRFLKERSSLFDSYFLKAGMHSEKSKPPKMQCFGSEVKWEEGAHAEFDDRSPMLSSFYFSNVATFHKLFSEEKTRIWAIDTSIHLNKSISFLRE